ncbi:MAG: anti-sigma factor family protein [bacterium]
MKKDCYYFSSRITGFIDSELPASETEAVQIHLDECSRCHAAYREELRVKDLVQERLPIVKAPFALKRRIRRQLIRNGERPGFWQLLHSLFVYQPVSASLALAVIILVMFLPSVQVVSTSLEKISSKSVESVASQTEEELQGEIICMDCELLSHNVEKLQHNPETHRMGFKTIDKRVWTFLDSDSNKELLHDQSLLKRKAVISGILFQDARYIYVKNYKLL